MTTEQLTARVRQLEDEARALSERLFRALDAKEECERDIEALRVEAHDVVRQWECEANNLRTQLIDALSKFTALEQQLKERDGTVADLSSQLHTLQEHAKQGADEVASLQGEVGALREKEQQQCSEIEALRESNAHYKSEVHSAYELVEDLKKEKGQVEAAHAACEDRLHECKAHVERIAQEKEEMACRLDTHMELVKTQHAATSVTLQQSEARLRDAVSQAEAAERTLLLMYYNECCQHCKSAIALRNCNDILQHQGQAVVEVQGELHDVRTALASTRQERDEAQRTLTTVTARCAELQNVCELKATELNTVNELYTATLYELEECKTTAKQREAEMKAQHAEALAVMAQRVKEATRASEAWQTAHKNVMAQLISAQCMLVEGEESTGRAHVACDAMRCLSELLHARVMVLCSTVLRHEVQLRQGTAQCTEQEDTIVRLQLERTELNEQLTVARQECARARGTISNMEANRKASDARLTECESERARLARDNAWLSERVEAMRQELGELDELLNANLNAMREENEAQSSKIATLRAQLEAATQADEELKQHVEAVERRCVELTSEVAAQARTLRLAESDLARAHETAAAGTAELAVVKQEQETLTAALAAREAECASLQRDVAALQERLQVQEKRSSLLIAEKRGEVAELRGKVNAYMTKLEAVTEQLSRREAECKAAEEAATEAKESQAKAKAAFERLKQRCQEYGETVQRLTSENEELVGDRNTIVERYNTLHEAYRTVRKSAAKAAIAEQTRLVELCSEQESELQRLRSENLLLKKSVALLISPSTVQAPQTSAAGQAFSERLNLEEGPLRQPRRRTAGDAP